MVGQERSPARATVTKFIETGCFVEVYEYGDAPRIYRDVDEDGQTDENESGEEREDGSKKARDVYDAKARRVRHYQAERHRIRRIIECNACGRCDPEQGGFIDCFFTLTYAENMTDERKGNRDFSNFCKRLKRYLAKVEPGAEFRYLACTERQKRGAVHYHCILFSFPYVPKQKLEEIWGHGFVDIKALNSLDDVLNTGLYVSKYFVKQIDHDYKRKKWFRSNNLKEPVELRTVTNGVDFGGADVALSYEYDMLTRNPDTGEWSVSKVKYTKVKNDGRGMSAFLPVRGSSEGR